MYSTHLLRQIGSQLSAGIQSRSDIAAKLYGYWITINCREAYSKHVSNGILFNHEGPIRSETFVTIKVTRSVARIQIELEQCRQLGNMDCRARLGPYRGLRRSLHKVLRAADFYALVKGEILIRPDRLAGDAVLIAPVSGQIPR